MPHVVETKNSKRLGNSKVNRQCWLVWTGSQYCISLRGSVPAATSKHVDTGPIRYGDVYCRRQSQQLDKTIDIIVRVEPSVLVCHEHFELHADRLQSTAVASSLSQISTKCSHTATFLKSTIAIKRKWKHVVRSSGCHNHILNLTLKSYSLSNFRSFTRKGLLNFVHNFLRYANCTQKS